MPWLLAIQRNKQTKKKKTKKNKPKYRKLGSTVRKNTNSGFLGGCEGQGLEEKMDVVSSESLGLPVSLRVASMNTGLKNTAAIHFWFNVEATVQVTILDFFLLKVFFLFTSLQTKRPKTNKKNPILLIKQTRKVTKALLWGVMGKNEHLYAFSGSSEIKTG